VIIRNLVPQPLNTHFTLLADMQPRDSFEAAAKERFAREPPFSTVLTGMANFVTATATALAAKLPTFGHTETSASSDAPTAAKNLLSYIFRK
jgi:hypothetical protein